MTGGTLILGASGFVARHLIRRLLPDDRELHLVSRHAIDLPNRNVVCHLGELGDLNLLARVLPRCATIIHLAAESTPGISARHPALETTSLTSTLCLLEALQSFPNRHLIYVSSGGAIYGNPPQNPVSENTPVAPRSYHAAGKASAELFLQTFALNKSARVTILRPSNLYGPEQALRTGFGVIRTMLEHVRLGTTMEIWGDGEAVRDYLYVDDMVEACIRVIPHQGKCSVYNVGSMTGYSLNQLADIVRSMTGKSLAINFREARQSDVSAVILDSSKLHRDLGWQPTIDLPEGIARTWQWLSTL